MRKFFSPHSIAVFGASDKPANLARRIVDNLQRFGFSGGIYPVGKGGGQLDGLPIYADIEDVPATPELAVLLVPAALIPGILEACGKKGVQRVIIETGGFTELDADNRGLEERIVAIAAAYGIRFIGPNCFGVINMEEGVVVPFFVIDPAYLKTGRASLISRASRLVEEIPLESLTVDTPVDPAVFERLSWRDTHNVEHDVSVPLTADGIEDLREEMARSAPPASEEDQDGDGKIDKVTYVVRKYRETWLPSVTLSLAVEYLHAHLADVDVVLGRHIRIPSPQRYNVETKAWEPYSVITRAAAIDPATGEVVKPEVRKVLTEVLIPIDEHGDMLINFMGYPSSASFGTSSTYPVRSYSRYASSPPGSDPETWDDTLGMANKIVMLGAFSQGMAEDQKPTPFGLMFGVEIHANALNTILMGNFLRYAPFWLSILILFGVVMLTAFMTSRLSTVWSLVVLVVVLAVYFGVVLVLFDFYAYILTLSAPFFGAFLSFLGVVAYRTVFEEKDKRRNKAIFSKIVGPAVLDQILEHPPELGGQDKELTVFFSDIRSFSSISEKMTSQELVNYLNKYFTVMTEIIKDYSGTLDKLIGDAVMGFWGAPASQPDHALLACKCALKQMEQLAVLNESWSEHERLDIGIGISTGIMTAAYMGSSDRLNYTVIGDAVNLGSRLEGMNKMYYDTSKAAGHFSRIIISENTYEQVKDKVIARELDVVRVKGKQEPAVIYELIDIEGGYEPPKPPESKGKILAAEAAADRKARAAKARGSAS